TIRRSGLHGGGRGIEHFEDLAGFTLNQLAVGIHALLLLLVVLISLIRHPLGLKQFVVLRFETRAFLQHLLGGIALFLPPILFGFGFRDIVVNQLFLGLDTRDGIIDVVADLLFLKRRGA